MSAVQTAWPTFGTPQVFYGTPGNIHHVGLYLGAGRMINAPTFGQPVQIDNHRYDGDDYAGATRPAASAPVWLLRRLVHFGVCTSTA
ncbi:NlpC/P60 family protein [Saccharothrix xinjiangensis]|uniref:NlpC/P60 family protein n=1 Tax=Saccharothrix xinjiangensis TaxID=204798 RepID=A0ABV9Y7K7_9PSEU